MSQIDIPIIRGVETTIDINQIYINFWNSVNEQRFVYTNNFITCNIFGLNDTVTPNFIQITQSQNINTLQYPLNNSVGNFINGTDYLREFKVTLNDIGSFYARIPNAYYFYDANNIYYAGGSVSGDILRFVVKERENINNVGLEYNKYDRVIRVEVNKTTQVSFGTDGLFPNGEQLIINSTLPAWITNNTINSYTQFWSLAPTSVGTYYYNASAYLRNNFTGDASITVIVVESLYEEIDNCCSDENVNIVWLNRQGGRGNYIFTQRKDFNVEVGKTNTYISNDIKRYSEIKNVHNGFKVYAKGISKNQIDFLDTLRYSIQCWQFINGVFVPLILDIGSFEKYNTKENMYEISMNFLYAERLNIQRQ